MPNDKEIWISRSQIPILPNFSMTDYASQGRTRPLMWWIYKIVKTKGEFILLFLAAQVLLEQRFFNSSTPDKIKGRLPGYLRSEFRELELLDEMTCLQYYKKLPSTIDAPTRTARIQQYQLWKGTDYVPSNVPMPLK